MLLPTVSTMSSRPRCCARDAGEFAPCYASVLAFGLDGLEAAVKGVEDNKGGLVSCFTAWCTTCRGGYLLTTDLADFPTPSAHHTHKLVLLANLRRGGVFPA